MRGDHYIKDFLIWAAEGMGKELKTQVSVTRRHASVVRDMKVSRKSMGALEHPVKQGGTADLDYSSLTESSFLSRTFFVL